MKSHKDLEIWKRSVDLVTAIYEVTKSFPKEEVYGIINQMRRCAISIPSNIAEGAARNSGKEFILTSDALPFSTVLHFLNSSRLNI